MNAPGVLCLVTDRRRLGGDAPSSLDRLLDLIGAAARAGVDLVQIREPDLDDRTLARLVEDAVDRTRSTPTRVVVNERADIALSAGAAGIHLRHDSFPAPRIRPLCSDDWLVGRSIHTVDEAQRVERVGGVDYVIMGMVFESASKPGRPPVGLDLLATVVDIVPVPTLAIGGVTVTRAGAVARSGAAGIAAIGEFVAGYGGARGGLDAVVTGFREPFDRREPSVL